ncbi:MAG: NAD(P)H-dependent oxidoreductase [Bacteroidota bacterium]
MKKVLVVNSSARTLRSQSRKLTEVFIDHYQSIHNNSLINYRELGNAEVPHINENWITASFKAEGTRTEEDKQILKISDTYIAELREADFIIIGSPMYNWSIPSTLKAYIDQILRVNETFKLDRTNMQHPYVGLLENKTLFLLLSRGEQGYDKGEYNEYLDFQSTYLKAVFNIIGISKIHIITINGASWGPENYKRSIDLSHQNIKDLIELELTR